MQDKDEDNIGTNQSSSVKNETVCVVVATYNRKELLLECLEALRRQTEPVLAIYIIDNASTDGTPELLLKNNYISKLPPSNLTEPWEVSFSISNLQKTEINSVSSIIVNYVRIHENTGGAGGFHEGVKRGYEKGYDWLWLMDDDVKPKNNCLQQLITINKLIFEETKKFPSALVCSRFLLNGKLVTFDCKKINLSNPFLKFHQRNILLEDLSKKYLRVESAPFEGLLINSNFITKIGFPDRRFFIYGDDTDYCLRLLKYGKIYYIPSAKIMRLIFPEDHSFYDWKTYYRIKNLIYLDLKYAKLIVKLIRIPYKFLRLLFGRIIKFDFSSIPIIISAFCDALKMYIEKYNYFCF